MELIKRKYSKWKVFQDEEMSFVITDGTIVKKFIKLFGIFFDNKFETNSGIDIDMFLLNKKKEGFDLPNIYTYNDITTEIYNNETFRVYTGDLMDGDLEKLVSKVDKDIIAEDILRGLTFLLSNHIIHSDIKPGNIFIKDGRAYISDFNIAIFSDPYSEFYGRGTPSTRSPESWTSKKSPCYIDQMWSLGVTLYYLYNERYAYIITVSDTNWTKVSQKINIFVANKRLDNLPLQYHGFLEYDPQNRSYLELEEQKIFYSTKVLSDTDVLNTHMLQNSYFCISANENKNYIYSLYVEITNKHQLYFSDKTNRIFFGFILCGSQIFVDLFPDGSYDFSFKDVPDIPEENLFEKLVKFYRVEKDDIELINFYEFLTTVHPKIVRKEILLAKYKELTDIIKD